MKTINNIAREINDESNTAEFALMQALFGEQPTSPAFIEIVARYYGIKEDEAEQYLVDLDNKGAFRGLHQLSEFLEAAEHVEAMLADLEEEFPDIVHEETVTIAIATDQAEFQHSIHQRLDAIEQTLKRIDETIDAHHAPPPLYKGEPEPDEPTERPTTIAGYAVRYDDEANCVYVNEQGVSLATLQSLAARAPVHVVGYDAVYNATGTVSIGPASLMLSEIQEILDGLTNGN